MNNVINRLFIGLFLVVLFLVSRSNYLLFHSLAELFSIVIAFGIFVIGWNSKKYYNNNYLLFIGIAYLFVAFFDTLHTFAYKGMTVFKGFDDNNLPPQLWLIARYMESIALLLAPFFLSRQLKPWRVFLIFSGVSLFALYAILYSQIFPVCFVTGSGLTPFKIGSEYLIDLILLAALYMLHKNRKYFDPDVLKLLALSIACTMVTELCFTVYVSLYGISNLVGHFFKILSFYFMYRAIIETALAKPYDLLFKNLQESEERFKALSEASFGGIIIHDNGHILECNKGLSSMTGFRYEELIGMNGLELIAPESLNTVLEHIRSGYDQSYEVEGVRKDGSTFPLAIKGKNVTYKGRDVRVIEFRDISEHKQAEAEREKLLMQLNQAQKMESVGRLAGGVAHEFNNKLTVIMGCAELALTNLHNHERLTKFLNDITKAAEYSRDIAAQLLAFSRKNYTVPQIIDPNRIIGETTKTLPRMIGENIRCTFLLAEDIWFVKIDPVQLDQIVLNMTLNARDAMPDGGDFTITTGNVVLVEEDCIAVPDAVPGEYVQIIFRDNGIGMDSETIAKIFEPFFTTKGIGKGTGLGLSSIYGMVRQNNGYIQVKSEPGQGSEFVVFLPRYIAQAIAQSAAE